MKPLFLLLFSLFLALPAGAAVDKGAQLRRTLAELLAPAEGEVSARKKRKALAEGLQLLPDLSEEGGLERLLKEAGLEEAGLVKIGEQSAAGLAAKLRGRFFRASGAVASALGLPESAPADLTRSVAARLGDLPPEKVEELLRLVPDDLLETDDDLFRGLRFSSQPAMERLKESVRAMELRGTSAADRAELADAIGHYFDHLPPGRKREIAVAWLRLPPSAGEAKELADAVEAAGPAVQKLFQLIAGGARDPLVRAVLAELQANVKPFDGKTALVILEESLGRPVGEVFSGFDPRPISAGTVGQIHEARLLSTGEKVAVKIQRPGVRERLAEDHAILREAAGERPAAQRILRQMVEHFEKEMDVKLEAANLDEMAVYADEARGLHVPRRVKELPLMDKVLVMELAEGKPLSRLESVDPRIRARALHHAVERWFGEALFGSGILHADLHPGNMMLKVEPGSEPGFRLTFVDAGSVGRLTLDQRRLLLRYAIAVITRSPTEMLRSLKEMGRVPAASEASLSERIALILREDRPSPFHRANEIMLEATKLGTELDPNYLLLSRSMETLQQQTKAANDALRASHPGARAYSMLGTFTRATLKRAAAEIPRQLVEPAFRDLATVETKLLPRALAGAAEGAELWFRRQATRPRRLLQGCPGYFSRILP